MKTLAVPVYADETPTDALVRCLKENIANGNLGDVTDELPEWWQRRQAVDEAAALLKARRSDWRDTAVGHYLDKATGRNGNMDIHDEREHSRQVKAHLERAQREAAADQRRAEQKHQAKLEADLKAAEQPAKDAMADAQRYAADQRRREAEGKAFVKAHADSRANRVKG